MQSPPPQSTPVKKQEEDDKGEKRDIKPVPKTLNRVPRACNACRKQKMRCEGADNPPCRRCRNTGLECLFEKPSREATLTGEAGLERIRSLEARVADIQATQSTISNTLQELLHHVRVGGGFQAARSPSSYPPSSFHQSPSLNSPAVSTPTPTSNHHASPGSGGPPFSAAHGHPNNLPPPRQAHRNSISNSGFPGNSSGHSVGPGDGHGTHLAPMFGNYPQTGQNFTAHNTTGSQGPVLPPFSSIIPPPPSNVSSVRYQPGDQSHARPANAYQSSSSKRQAPSAITSADSSDVEDDENGELPASGLLAPWEVLRGLADVALERAITVGRNSLMIEPHSRARTPSPERQSRPSKRRKIKHMLPQPVTFQDVITKQIISESDARELFNLFYHGCSTFLPVFDSSTDTYDALHERSPFAVNAICAVAARVRDGGAPTPSEVQRKCLEEVQKISSATLFAPVLRCEAVQAMILVSGWSDNGWLSGGHAVRMAMELSMHTAWPKLYKRMLLNKINPEEDRQLVIMSRTWFCLYLFEHQLSYGTGRPAVLKDDESIRGARHLCRHPLTIEDDMRLVSTVELIAIRERVHNALAPYEGPVLPQHFEELHKADLDFKDWYKSWDIEFSSKYENAAFYRQSLQIQHLHAELFHNATALRGINGPEDVENMPATQRQLALRSIETAQIGLDITVNSAAYREGMKYAVHYTHATATFAASFLLRLGRLFPEDCDMQQVREKVERLAELLNNIPAKRYATTLTLMLKRSRKRSHNSSSRSPTLPRDPSRSLMNIDHHSSTSQSANPAPPQYGRNSEQFPPPYAPSYQSHPLSVTGLHHGHHNIHTMHQAVNPLAQQYPPHIPQPNFAEADQILRAMDGTDTSHLPVWMSDQSLGGQSFTQQGMDAFMIPQDYLPPQTQIW
ncbi:hypothetical protein CPB83DRAFT_767806 [Crepidotus variabilis]|uniref:Zn(2)-C6 fungal-type domain-containing protein n=1 Tax=Crepidotus variabilis TaxID=179855 RepID=A0A9P6EFG7_9AGAR|nr:hypothetical protein CPB83DRAFT_767806 [Crepidotus variabilis]